MATSEDDVIDIGEVARRSGCTVSTLRYYEQRGLIASVGRHGLRRQFASTVVQHLGLIALGRAAGFRLDEIATMITADGRPAIDRERLRERAREIDRSIDQLAVLRDTLRHTADCPEENHLDCASFQRLLQSVSETPRTTHTAPPT